MVPVELKHIYLIIINYKQSLVSTQSYGIGVLLPSQNTRKYILVWRFMYELDNVATCTKLVIVC